ncbi:hypothetical protein AKJ16_DCAP14385 [Drosera capensis]
MKNSWYSSGRVDLLMGSSEFGSSSSHEDLTKYPFQSMGWIPSAFSYDSKLIPHLQQITRCKLHQASMNMAFYAGMAILSHSRKYDSGFAKSFRAQQYGYFLAYKITGTSHSNRSQLQGVLQIPQNLTHSWPINTIFFKAFLGDFSIFSQRAGLYLIHKMRVDDLLKLALPLPF